MNSHPLRTLLLASLTFVALASPANADVPRQRECVAPPDSECLSATRTLSPHEAEVPDAETVKNALQTLGFTYRCDPAPGQTHLWCRAKDPKAAPVPVDLPAQLQTAASRERTGWHPPGVPVTPPVSPSVVPSAAPSASAPDAKPLTPPAKHGCAIAVAPSNSSFGALALLPVMLLLRRRAPRSFSPARAGSR